MKIEETREFRLEASGLKVRAIGPCDKPPDMVEIANSGLGVAVHHKDIPQLIALLDTMQRKLKRWATNGTNESAT